ncbi:MAG TPA: hypothetical protein VL460_11310 [Caulobacteraceae bacterium]|jgi:hypothetical protein|nr:hypothetical protein [Caulobacteraceae bacterium]
MVLVFAFQLAPGDPAPASPAAVAPAPEPPAAPDAPRRVDDLSRPLTGQVPQGSYEAGVRGAFTRTQSLQGPLDGTWMLKDAAGAALYRVQLVDPGFGGGALEGAWSDLHAASPAESSGFFVGVARDGAHLTLQFARSGAGQTTVNLDQRADGGFAGELRAGAGGKGEAVTLVRP